jgi:hypothetical protein
MHKMASFHSRDDACSCTNINNIRDGGCRCVKNPESSLRRQPFGNRQFVDKNSLHAGTAPEQKDAWMLGGGHPCNKLLPQFVSARLFISIMGAVVEQDQLLKVRVVYAMRSHVKQRFVVGHMTVRCRYRRDRLAEALGQTIGQAIILEPIAEPPIPGPAFVNDSRPNFGWDHVGGPAPAPAPQVLDSPRCVQHAVHEIDVP